MSKNGRAFHNLAGLVRDLRAALQAGETLAYEFAELLLEVDDLIIGTPDDDSGLPDPDGSAGGGGQLDLDVPDAPDGGALGGLASGHAPVQPDVIRVSPGVGASMERVRALASQAAGVRGVPPGVVPTVARNRVLRS